MIDGSKPPADIDQLLAKSDYIEDGVDVYERFIGENLYEKEQLPNTVANELECRDLDYGDPDHAMRVLATDLAMEATQLRDQMDRLSGYLSENMRSGEIPELAEAKKGEQRVREAGTEGWPSKEVDGRLPNENYSPGRIYLEHNKADIMAAGKSIAESSSFLSDGSQ